MIRTKLRGLITQSKSARQSRSLPPQRKGERQALSITALTASAPCSAQRARSAARRASVSVMTTGRRPIAATFHVETSPS